MLIETKYNKGTTLKDGSYIGRIMINIRDEYIAEAYDGEEIEVIYDLWKKVGEKRIWMGSVDEKYIDEHIEQSSIYSQDEHIE